eukprot:scaffold359_cov351-Pinguiococcus_pyrenoidosus.AAC.3
MSSHVKWHTEATSKRRQVFFDQRTWGVDNALHHLVIFADGAEGCLSLAPFLPEQIRGIEVKLVAHFAAKPMQLVHPSEVVLQELAPASLRRVVQRRYLLLLALRCAAGRTPRLPLRHLAGSGAERVSGSAAELDHFRELLNLLHRRYKLSSTPRDLLAEAQPGPSPRCRQRRRLLEPTFHRRDGRAVRDSTDFVGGLLALFG